MREGSTRRRIARAATAVAVGALTVTAVGATAATTAADASVQDIETLSNRADLVSGGDALVAIELAPGTDPATTRVLLNGTDVTDDFAVRESGGFEGLVTGLAVGENALVARGPVGNGRALTITNHPIGGPVFAGPQVTPWICNTNASTPPLGDPVDEKCNAPTRVELLYRNTSGQFAPYDPSQPPPAADIQQTTTDTGKTVPFIIQRVTGTADRGIYQIAVLVDPSQPITPWSTAQPWSHKLVYSFGGGCGTDHTQRAPGNVLQAIQLGLGFAVATSSLNTYQQNCNDVVSAEATMMTKEIVVERYGEILYTIGSGFSAGTMQQHLLAENYPGLLDGLMTGLAFPDHFEQVMGSLDCRVLMHYFWPTSPLTLPDHAAAPPNPLFPTPTSRLPVWGSHPANPDNLCGQKVLLFGADRTELLPGSGVGCGLPMELVWNPVTNPAGERCGITDYMRSVFGVTVAPDAPKGKGLSVTDNVGVQYGHRALRTGQITPEQFVDLNWRIGGIDIDGNFTSKRKKADPHALSILYRTGRVNSGTGAADIPEIDNRTGLQGDDTGFHPAFESWAYRARLDAANGNHDNHVIWLSRPGGVVPSQFDYMRQWLDALVTDTSDDSQAVKVRRAKPASLGDACFLPGGVEGDLSCNGTWQYYGAPRQVAGGPLASDVMKCQLKPLDAADYTVAFTSEQWAKLQESFPTGVCDYTKPGLQQRPPKARWLTFAGGPGGRRASSAAGLEKRGLTCEWIEGGGFRAPAFSPAPSPLGEAGVQRPHTRLQRHEQRGPLLGRQLGQHLLLHLVHHSVTRGEHPATLRRESCRVDAAVVRMGIAPDQALALQCLDDLHHRLRRHVRTARELRVGERLPPGPEDAHRRVLQRRQPVRPHSSVDAGADRTLETRDRVADSWLDRTGDGALGVVDDIRHVAGSSHMERLANLVPRLTARPAGRDLHPHRVVARVHVQRRRGHVARLVREQVRSG